MNINIEKVLEEHKKWLNGEGEVAASLPNADLSYADLHGIDLHGANLKNANLRGADLRDADLRGVDLRGANLRGAKIENVTYNEYTCFFAMQCPEEGPYIGYKRALNEGKSVIIKILIPEDALRSSSTSRKCRASKAKVLDITSIDKKENFQKAVSLYDKSFVYKVGETVEVKNFDRDRWNECSTGIHHFITYGEAVNY